MNAISNYIINMIPYMIIAVPIYLIIRFLMLRKSSRKFNLYHEIALLIFVIFIVGLASQTVIPKIELGINGNINILKNGTHGINLLPLKVLFETYREVFINLNINYFVTGFDLYTLKKGLEILSGLTEVINLTKVLFSRTASKEDNDYLNYLSLGYKIVWNDEIIYFPFEVGDQSVIAENQRVAKIKFKKLSAQYKEALIYIVEQILNQDEYAKMKKIFKQLEKGG